MRTFLSMSLYGIVSAGFLSVANLAQAIPRDTQLSAISVPPTQALQSSDYCVKCDLSHQTNLGFDFSDTRIQSSSFRQASLDIQHHSPDSSPKSTVHFAHWVGHSLTLAQASSLQVDASTVTDHQTSPVQPTNQIIPSTDTGTLLSQESPETVTPETSEPSLEEDAQPEETESLESPQISESPLSHNLFPQPTAEHLNRGDVVFGFTNRQFFNSDTQGNDATAANPGVHIDWGITDTTELGLSFQVVDTGSPERQGPFDVRREDNLDGTIRLKQRVWQSDDEDLAISLVPSVAFGNRSYEFRGVGPIQVFSNNEVVPSLQVPVTASLAENRFNLTLSPTAVFFPADHALFLRRLPTPNSGSFGTNFGLSGALSYNIHPRLTLWGDAFVPFTGNNSLNLNTGRPAKAIAFNSGVRYFVNPRLGLDLFASNTLGQKAPLGLTAERNSIALGLGIHVMPELFSSNRKYKDSYSANDDGRDSPLTVDGLGFADGGTVPKNRLALQVQGGQQGVLTALRYGVARDFEVFGYLDYVLGRVDESEQGFGLKVRLLEQDSNGPLTISAAASVGLTNEVFRNFIDNDPTAFNALGRPKEVPLVFQVDNPQGRRFLVSASLPIHYKVNDQVNTWFTPTLGYAQRLGVELAGVNLGGSFEFAKDVSLVAEVGANFIGRGNSFNNARLVDRIPWSVAARWNPSTLFGFDENALIEPHLEVYVTNRSGSSIWNQLRVREGGDPAVGVGVLIPF